MGGGEKFYIRSGGGVGIIIGTRVITVCILW